MNHLEYLVELLRPLGVYDLRDGRLNRGELEAYAMGLDEGGAWLEETAREMALMTAEGLGLEQVEGLLAYRPASPDTAQRRRALAALLRIGGDRFTPEAINDTLVGCGINARGFPSSLSSCGPSLRRSCPAIWTSPMCSGTAPGESWAEWCPPGETPWGWGRAGTVWRPGRIEGFCPCPEGCGQNFYENLLKSS